MTKRKRYTPKIGDFVCVNSPNIHKYDIYSLYWQTIGKVISADIETGYNDGVSVLFPFSLKDIDSYWFKKEEVRKATAYEGMMAFWNPEEENRLFFEGEHQSLEDKERFERRNKRLGAAREKADVSNLKVEDF